MYPVSRQVWKSYYRIKKKRKTSRLHMRRFPIDVRRGIKSLLSVSSYRD